MTRGDIDVRTFMRFLRTVTQLFGLPELDVMAGAVRNLAAVVTWASATDNMMALLDAWHAGNPTTKARRP